MLSDSAGTTPPDGPPSTHGSRRLTLRANVAFKALSVPVEKAVRLVVMIVAAPALGQAAFGTYQFVTTIATFLVMGTEFGLSVWTTRALARDQADAGRIVSTSLAVRAAGASIYVVGIAVVVIVLPDVPWQITVLLGLAGIANAFNDFLGAIFRGLERLDEEAVVNISRACFLALFALGALRMAPTLPSLSIGVASGTCLGALIGTTLLVRRHPTAAPRRARFDRDLARQALRQSASLWVAAMLSLLYFKVDVVILQLVAGDSALGAYSAAYKLFEAMTLPPAIVMAAAFPQLARAINDRERQRLLERRVLAALLVLGTAAGGAMYLLSELLVRWIFGPGFGAAAPSLRILSLGLPLLFVGLGLRQFLVARNLERLTPLLTGALLLLNVALNIATIGSFGGEGAAAATVATEAAQIVICLWLLRSRGET